MSLPQGEERRRCVSRMFSRIAPRYDLMNRLMTAGQDVRLRRLAVRRLQVPPSAVVLDIGSGTGDIAAEVLRRHPTARVVALDLTPAMLAISKRRFPRLPILRVVADAQALPFAPASCQRAACGYLLRNVPEPARALAEVLRVLAPGGRMVSLDTTPLQEGPLKPLLDLYLQRVIPLLGRLLTGDAEAYAYLPASTAAFLSAGDLASAMQAAGFRGVGFSRHLFGSMALHAGGKP